MSELKGLNEFAAEVHDNAVKHGWWETERELPELISLMHSELSEALEEFREGRNDTWYECLNHEATDLYGECCNGCDIASKNTPCHYRSQKPEGVTIELMDCIIRILDYCGNYNIDVEEALNIKHRYNLVRQYRHGGKKI